MLLMRRARVSGFLASSMCFRYSRWQEGRLVPIVLRYYFEWFFAMPLVEVEVAVQRKDTVLTEGFGGSDK
jgi:hypothetical protein